MIMTDTTDLPEAYIMTYWTYCSNDTKARSFSTSMKIGNRNLLLCGGLVKRIWSSWYGRYLIWHQELYKTTQLLTLKPRGYIWQPHGKYG